MKNKGFSLVELIIVIAIMAILAGALAPALIKYINKSRLSTDIDNGATIARTIMAAVTDDDAFKDAQEVKDTDPPRNVNDMQGDTFKQIVFNNLGVTHVQGGAKKDVDGGSLNQNYYYRLDSARNKVEVYYGGTDSDYMVYPSLGSKLSY